MDSRRHAIRTGDGCIHKRNFHKLGENPKLWRSQSTKQIMFNTTLDRPAHGSGSSGANASTLNTWLAAARRLAGRDKVPVARDRAREAEALRELAYTYRDRDRGFADDLYAAASRHENTAD
jgi:hypothetical protein